MKAGGSMLAGGILEQITRCDVGWETGWFVQASTTDPENVRVGECQAQLNPAG
jgi:hypothetical protein